MRKRIELMSRRQVRGKGFTLMEVLVSIMTLAVSLATILFTITQALQNIRQNNLGLLAKTAASQEMEALRNQPFATIGTAPFTANLPQDLQTLGAVGLVSVCNYDPGTGACGALDNGIKEVTVTVSLDPSRAWRLVSLFSNSS